jgi:hypothetical protein
VAPQLQSRARGLIAVRDFRKAKRVSINDVDAGFLDSMKENVLNRFDA